MEPSKRGQKLVVAKDAGMIEKKHPGKSRTQYRPGRLWVADGLTLWEIVLVLFLHCFCILVEFGNSRFYSWTQYILKKQPFWKNGMRQKLHKTDRCPPIHTARIMSKKFDTIQSQCTKQTTALQTFHGFCLFLFGYWKPPQRHCEMVIGTGQGEQKNSFVSFFWRPFQFSSFCSWNILSIVCFNCPALVRKSNGRS